MGGFYRGRGGLKLAVVVASVWAVLWGASALMHRAAGEWMYIPAIVIGAGVLLAMLLFKLIGPLS